MKPIVKLLAVVLALGFVASASAQTRITITGSTAFRGNAHAAILAALTGEVYGYTGTDLNGASQAIFTGNLGATPVIIYTSWSGSITGIVAVRNSTNVNTLPDSTPQSAGGTPNATTGTVARLANLAMTDVSFTSTPFATAAMAEQEVGVIPFQFVAGYNSTQAPYAGLTNFTGQLARQLWSNGFIPLAMATGLVADRTTTIASTFTSGFFGTNVPRMLYALGRNAGSGTRFLTLAETGVGVNSSIQQWDPRSFISGSNLTNHALWPAESVDGIFYPEGSSGYSSGSQLRAIMRLNTEAGIGGTYITVLGIDDAADVTNPSGSGAGPGKTLTYEGVPYSVVNIQEGRYTLWSFEQMVYRTADNTGTLATFITTLVANMQAADPVYAGMQVSRSTDGGTVFPNYP